MSGEKPSEDELEDLLEAYRVNPDTRYVMDSSNLGPQFHAIDDYLSGFPGEAKVELAETGFLKYHEKGVLEEGDQVVVYAELDEAGFNGERTVLEDGTEIVLGRSHRESVPVEFVSGENPFRSYTLYMPTHEAVNAELQP